MNKFIKLPLFLSAACLIAGGMLVGVSALTEPVVEQHRLEKLAKAFKEMYSDESAIAIGQIEINDGTIQSVTKVEHSGETSVVYYLKSKSKYETMYFYLGISQTTNKVDNYYHLETPIKSNFIGTDYENNEKMNGIYVGYAGDGTYQHFAGVTFTGEGVGTAVDAAFKDYNSNKRGNW